MKKLNRFLLLIIGFFICSGCGLNVKESGSVYEGETITKTSVKSPKKTEEGTNNVQKARDNPIKIQPQ